MEGATEDTTEEKLASLPPRAEDPGREDGRRGRGPESPSSPPPPRPRLQLRILLPSFLPSLLPHSLTHYLPTSPFPLEVALPLSLFFSVLRSQYSTVVVAMAPSPSLSPSLPYTALSVSPSGCPSRVEGADSTAAAAPRRSRPRTTPAESGTAISASLDPVVRPSVQQLLSLLRP